MAMLGTIISYTIKEAAHSHQLTNGIGLLGF